MKKRTWLYLLLAVLFLLVFLCYRAVKRLGTDTKAPQINISTDVHQVSVQDTAEVLLQGVTAKDDTDGGILVGLANFIIKNTQVCSQLTQIRSLERAIFQLNTNKSSQLSIEK